MKTKNKKQKGETAAKELSFPFNWMDLSINPRTSGKTRAQRVTQKGEGDWNHHLGFDSNTLMCITDVNMTFRGHTRSHEVNL